MLISSSVVRRIVAATAVTLGALLCSGCHLMNLVRGQMRVVTSTEPVAVALKDPSLSAKDKDTLRYIQAVKVFAVNQVGLADTCSYTVYLPGPRKPLTWSVTASERESLTPVTWWYPIVGTVPYDGFFDRNLAIKEGRELKAKGKDVVVWPDGGYSTLGFFCDPITPLMLDVNKGSLAALIIHEMVHATLMIPGQGNFNESLADFVADKEAPVFLREHFGPGNRYAVELRRRLAVEREVNDIIRSLAERLHALYAAHPHDVLARREKLFSAAKEQARQACSRIGAKDELCYPHALLNNAVVLLRLTYGSPAPIAHYYKLSGGDWQLFFQMLRVRYEPRQWYPEL